MAEDARDHAHAQAVTEAQRAAAADARAEDARAEVDQLRADNDRERDEILARLTDTAKRLAEVTKAHAAELERVRADAGRERGLLEEARQRCANPGRARRTRARPAARRAPGPGGPGMTIWSDRAERLLEQAIGEVHDGTEPIIIVSAALAALRVDIGELPASELDGYPFPGEPEDESGCTCPAELRARGGFRSSCPVCSRWTAES